MRDGKVAVGTTLVTAAHVAKVSLHGFTQLSATDGSMFSFAARVLTLPHMTLLQAIPELDRWYAVDIRIGDSSLARVPIRGFRGRIVVRSHTQSGVGIDVRVSSGWSDAHALSKGETMRLHPRQNEVLG